MKTFLVGFLALCAIVFAPMPAAHAQRQNIIIGNGGTQVDVLKVARVTLVAGVATVSDTGVNAITYIHPTRLTAAGTPGVSIITTRTNGTSFTFTSKAADGTTTASSDTSVIEYLYIQPHS